MAHNGIVELLCIYGFIFGGLAVLLLLLLFVYSVFLLVFRRRKTACTELGFLCSAFIIWFVNYVFSGGGLFHPVGAALFWLVVFRFLYILRRKRTLNTLVKRWCMDKNSVLLITGGTGSFGNAVLKRFLDTDIGEIRVFSRDEKKQDDMRKCYAHPKLRFYIGDVRDYQSTLNATRGVDYIFHAAALKQVPLL